MSIFWFPLAGHMQMGSSRAKAAPKGGGGRGRGRKVAGPKGESPDHIKVIAGKSNACLSFLFVLLAHGCTQVSVEDHARV